MNDQNARLIVNFAPTGMIPTREMPPHVPVSTAEIVEDIHEAVEVGITMVHIHARDGTNERQVMSPAELRTLLDLEPGNGVYGRRSSHTASTSRAGQPG